MQYGLDATSKVYSYVEKSLMNVDAMKQSVGCQQEGGKQGTMSMYKPKSSSKDDEASRQEDGGREAILPSLNDECTPMIEAPR